jgi:dipeptidyl aminopeptidase/acylaminoacyl peptidase/predicted Ser/Thr protein kinase
VTTSPKSGAIPEVVGPYRVEREIARGGMGVVYLARDTHLDRLVAIKTLPADLAEDRERLARFEREARIVASLNHPNIAGIHGLEQVEGRRYLAFEYVEGKTLADRIMASPLGLDDTIEIGLQVASAMEAAHEKGIVHRDLKPRNVMIASNDVVKVLDFGLAKGRVASESDVEMGESPTLTGPPQSAPGQDYHSAMTTPGVILGTVAYLAPEQARGKPVDRRADIWAFGCMLYECLTGRRAFQAPTTSETIAKVLERDPDWSLLPPTTPIPLVQLLQHCLQKDPKHRLRDMGDARLALEEIRLDRTTALRAVPEGASARWRAVSRHPLARALVLLLLGAAIGIPAWSTIGPGGGTRIGLGQYRGVARFDIQLPPSLNVQNAALSPDGRTMVLLGQTRRELEAHDPTLRLYARRLDQETFVPLRGTDGCTPQFAFSHDGRWIVFVRSAAPGAENQLFRISVAGNAPPVAIGPWDFSWAGLAGLANQQILIGVNGTHFVILPESGGPSSTPVRYQYPDSNVVMFPTGTTPDGRHVFMTLSVYEDGAWRSGSGVLDPRTGVVKLLLRDGGQPAVTPTDQLLFTRGDALLAAPFDERRLVITGSPTSIKDGLRTFTSWMPAPYQLGADGTLFHATGGVVGRARRPVSVGRTREDVEVWPYEQEFVYGVSISPDGRRFATVIPNDRLLTDVWVYERSRPVGRRVAAVPGADLAGPIWSPDGRKLAFLSGALDSRDGIYVQDATGSGTPHPVFLHYSAVQVSCIPTSWSPDGRKLLVTAVDQGRTDVVLVSLTASGDSTGAAQPLLAGPASEGGAQFSPDGRWIAYVSNESGSNEVYVRSYSPEGVLGRATVVSTKGGVFPRWSADGRRLYYLAPSNKLLSVSCGPGSQRVFTEPVEAWDLTALGIPGALVGAMFDIQPDGRLFAIRMADGEQSIQSAEVTLNFLDFLRRRTAGSTSG